MPQLEILNGLENDSKETKSEGKKGNNLKKLFKKKPFLIAVGVVSILGLWAWYRKGSSGSSSASTDETSMLYASGYTGYPYTQSDYTEVHDAYTESTLDAITDAFDQRIESVQSVYDTTNEAILSQVNTLSERVNNSEQIIQNQSDAIQKQNDIAQMKANSDAYHYATTTAQKEALHEANNQIASKYGWTFNDDDGYWYDGNTRVYQTVIQANGGVSTINNKTSSSTGSTGSTGSAPSGYSNTHPTTGASAPSGFVYNSQGYLVNRAKANGGTYSK